MEVNRIVWCFTRKPKRNNNKGVSFEIEIGPGIRESKVTLRAGDRVNEDHRKG